MQTLSHAATLSVTPGSISNLYAGNLTLQIGGLTNGETVLIERFIDLNANGTVDSSEPLVQSFRLTDGQVTSIAGVRNANIPGDNDLASNGQITATVNFANGAEFTRASAGQIVRLSSPTGHFLAVQQTLTVTQSVYPQQITGTVSSGGSPLPFALVGALVQIGSDNVFVVGAVANASGTFSLSVSNGTYEVIGFSPGYIGSFATSPLVTVAGSTTNVTVPLTAANFTMSGSVTDAVSGAGLPGFQFFATSQNNEYGAFFSDAQGNFSVTLNTGQWKLEPSDSAMLLGGYFRLGNKPQVDVSGANVTGVMIPITKATAMIYGTVKDDQNNPLGGLRLSANDYGNLFQSTAFTDASGNYFLAATNATWNVGTDNQGTGLPNGYTLQSAQVTITNGQAVQTNLVAKRATAHLLGHASDSNSNPIGGGSMLAFGTNGTTISAQLAGDGSFDLPVSGGNWSIGLESETASSRNLVAPQLSFNVTDGVNISNINYVALVSTRTISGSVKTGNNIALSGLNVYAGSLVNGTNYFSSGTTDAGGNYSMLAIAGLWNVGVDSQGLAERGYGMVFNQDADTSSGNQVVNFVVGSPPVGFMIFRHMLGVVGEFGNSRAPSVSYPVSIKNYRVIFRVLNDTNPPSASTVLFTGPAGSGLTNTPADSAFGAVQDGTNVIYSSPAVHTPSAGMGGNWTVSYRANANNFVIPDPQASSRIVVPLPTITLSNDVLRSLVWSYRDLNGNPISGTPPFVQTNRLDLIDQNGNLFDSQIFPSTMSYTYAATNLYHWSGIGTLRLDYYDDLTNQYFVGFTESSPTLTGAARLTGQRYQFLLNGLAGQNYTIQFSTNLSMSNWNALLVTNPLASPITIIDPAATNPARFYRVLLGP